MSDTRSALLRASKPPTKELFSTLITANHILHYHNVVDGTCKPHSDNLNLPSNDPGLPPTNA